MTPNQPVPREDEECYTLVEYLELLKGMGKILMYSHIPNETFTKSWGIKMKNKKLGVRTGVPDYLVVTPTEVLFIEMKRVKGGVVSPEQWKWLDHLDQKPVATALCRGFDKAKEFLKEHV